MISPACLTECICKDVKLNQEMLKVLHLGPFKHMIDQGQELRSIVYQLLIAIAVHYFYILIEL